jgi:hypothetical protein
MGTKLGKKEIPSGHAAGDFKYVGRPAKDQGDFGSDVGLADMACVNQFGEANNSKYYHGGVVQSTKTNGWFCYFQWGRIKSAGESWVSGSFREQDFQFVECSSEADARSDFAKQMNSKNTKRLVSKQVGGVTVWMAKPDDDGYIVQSLATRTRGLPDAYQIKDKSGIVASDGGGQAPLKDSVGVGKTPGSSALPGPRPSRIYHPAEIALVAALMGGTKDYTRSLSKASGVVPTMDAITRVRDQLIPAALTRCAAVGNDVQDQLRDDDLKAISKMVFAMVPQHIPRGGLQPEDAILNAGNILRIQQDLDAFESALKGEDFSVETTKTTTVDADTALNAKLTWVDPNSEIGRWVANTYRSMTRNRHGDLAGQTLKIMNMFAIERPDRDARFVASVKAMAAKRTRLSNDVPPGLQPSKRPDLTDVGDWASQANVFVGIHGTRGVNVGPILGSHLRLPKSLAGVQITGAAFGHGIYFATDLKKSWGYTGYSSRWGSGGGNITGRGAFMFLADVVGGQFHYPRSAWGINDDKCPGGADSVYAHPSKITSLANDEHVIFNADHCRLRYLIEMDFS